MSLRWPARAATDPAERHPVTDIDAHRAEQVALAHRRLDAQESRINKLEIHTAGEAVRSQNIERSLTEIQSGITWVTRLVIGGLIGAALAFIISGGFNV